MINKSFLNMSTSIEEMDEHWVSKIDSICSSLNVDPVAAKKSKESFAEVKRNFTLDVSNCGSC